VRAPIVIAPLLPAIHCAAAGLTARRLGLGDAPTVAAFCRASSAFFTLVAGTFDADDTARDVLDARPPGVGSDRLHAIGVERGALLAAVVDLLEDYPGERDWYVGLLLVTPGERHQGVGRAVWDAMEEWIRSRGGHRVNLIVQEQNPDAARFWESAGFSADGEVDQVLTTRTNRCWRFTKCLTDAR
jgi:GNAT superfamily N-acetyltransferase